MLRKLKTWIFRKKTKAIVFDYDGVLNDSIDAVRKVYNEFFYRGLTNRYFKDNDEFSEFFQGDMYKNMEAAGMELTRENMRKSDAIVKDMHPIFDESMKLYPNVDRLLLKLKDEGCKLGIVSNGDKDMIKAKLRKYNIGSIVDVVVGYDEVSKAKPSPEGLLKCLEELGVKPCDALYIGDMESDIKAAKAAGIEVVAVTYGYLKTRPDIYNRLKGADYFAHSIDEVYDRIERWSKKSRKGL